MADSLTMNRLSSRPGPAAAAAAFFIGSFTIGLMTRRRVSVARSDWRVRQRSVCKPLSDWPSHRGFSKQTNEEREAHSPRAAFLLHVISTLMRLRSARPVHY